MWGMWICLRSQWAYICLMQIHEKKLGVWLVFLLAVLLPAQGILAQAEATVIDTKAVREELNRIKAASGMRNGQFGFVLYDVQTGKLLEKERPDETLLPASTLKTVTSAAAFGILGPNCVCSTVAAAGRMASIPTPSSPGR